MASPYNIAQKKQNLGQALKMMHEPPTQHVINKKTGETVECKRDPKFIKQVCNLTAWEARRIGLYWDFDKLMKKIADNMKKAFEAGDISQKQYKRFSNHIASNLPRRTV